MGRLTAADRPAAALAVVLVAALIPALLVVPRLGSSPSVLSVASVEGYNTSVAAQLAVVWIVVALVLAMLLSYRGWLDAPATAAEPAMELPSPRRRRIERLVVAVACLLAFFPPFLARYGPYIEDAIFTNALQRMQGGMVPFRDFEFLYGPLMLEPAHWAMRIAGYSMRHYYAWLAVLETAQYVLVIALLQHLVPRARTRYLVFLLLVVFLSNPLLGINYNGIRRLLPLGALLLLASDPEDWRGALLAAVLLGLGIGYSHDTGLVALVAAAALYALILSRTRSLRLAGLASLVGIVALATWAITTFAVLGASGWSGYIADTRALVARFSAGEAGFRFYWTANSLAGFSLVAVAAIGTGRYLVGASRLDWGERFQFAALIASMLMLKSALNRSDVWHLQGAFLPLIVAWLLPLPRAVGRLVFERVAGLALIVILAVTYAIGTAPTAAYAAQGWVRGARDVLADKPTASDACAPDAIAPCIEKERTEGRADFVALGRWLAEPAQRNRRVLLYGELWSAGPRLGIYQRDHLNDDFIYDDARGQAAGRWIAAAPDGMVVMTKTWYRHFEAPPGDTVGYDAHLAPSAVKSLGEWLASVHYREVGLERGLFEARWRRTVGAAIRPDFSVEKEFGDLVVLSRRTAG